MAILVAAPFFACSALAAEITFRVQMAYQIELGSFDPGSDFVDLAGDFNGWGSDPLTPVPSGNIIRTIVRGYWS